jgi:hypothetical protein
LTWRSVLPNNEQNKNYRRRPLGPPQCRKGNLVTASKTRRRPPKVDTERMALKRASARHLKDLGRWHAEPPADVKVNMRGVPKLVPPDPRAILLYVARGALRGPGGPDGRRVRGASRVGGTWGVVQLSGARKPAKRTRKSPQELLDAVQERLDATPERLARARESGQTPTRDADRTRRIIDPFDAMRANRVLAPHDPKLNDIRWLVGESLRRTHQRAKLDQLRAVAPDRFGSTGFGPRPGLPQSETALFARDKLREAEDRVGPHAWPIVTRIGIEGAGVRDCRGFIPELATPWRADAVVSDRLRVALDVIGGLMGVTPRRGK